MKKTEKIMTKLDGIQPITWWDKEDFTGRQTTMVSGNTYEEMMDNNPQFMPIPDDYIICDYCDAPLTEFPVPVFHGHALCQACYNNKIKR